MSDEAPRAELERLQTDNPRDEALLRSWPSQTAELASVLKRREVAQREVDMLRERLTTLREREELLRDNHSNAQLRARAKLRRKGKRLGGPGAPWDSHFTTIMVAGTLGMLGSMALLHGLAVSPPAWVAVTSTLVGLATPLVVDYLRIVRVMGKRAVK